MDDDSGSGTSLKDRFSGMSLKRPSGGSSGGGSGDGGGGGGGGGRNRSGSGGGSSRSTCKLTFCVGICVTKRLPTLAMFHIAGWF